MESHELAAAIESIDFQEQRVTIPFGRDMIESQGGLKSCLVAAGSKPSADFVSQRCAEHCKIIAQREWANLGYQGPFEIASYDETSATLVRALHTGRDE